MPLADRLRAIKSVVRNTFARETLDEAPAGAPARPHARVAAMLFEREPLATEPELSPARAGILRMLLAPEALPEDPVAPATPRRGMLHALFAPEALAEHPAAPPRPRRSAWLRWLFRPEALDPPGR